MRNFKKALLLILCVVLSFGVFSGCKDEEVTYELPHYDYADSDGTMCNTDLFYVNVLQAYMGDPEIISVEEEGELVFYSTGTSTGVDFRMYRSTDLTHWDDIGVVYTPEENAFQEESHWAPNVIWDEEADWQYYLGESAGEGKGLYCMFFTGRDNDNVGKTTQLQVAFSKKITGPYVTFKGINANGDWCDASTYHFNVEKLKGLGLYANHVYGDLYKKDRRFLDSFPFVDPVTGDKYMYFCRGGRNVGDTYNEIWGVKMKDWVSPDYPTTTPLTAFGYTTIDKDVELNWAKSRVGIDEGPAMIYKDFTDDGVDNGTYYLTCSISASGDKYYSPIQALCSSPLGKFEKVQPEDGGFIALPNANWDIISTGHHDMIWIGDELWNVYHTYKIQGSSNYSGRYLACDKVEFMPNADGKMIMYTNGPSKTPQPLPELMSGYRNLAKNITPTVTNKNVDATLLTDGLIPMTNENQLFEEMHLPKEFSTTDGNTTITIKFDSWVTARAILIYNSTSWGTMFENVEKVEFNTKNGKAVIKDLGVNLDFTRVPYYYFDTDEDDANVENYNVIRPCVASIAEFNELEVNEVKITIKKASGKEALAIGEVMVLGKRA